MDTRRETALYWLKQYLHHMMTEYRSYNLDAKSNAYLMKIVANGMEWLALHSHEADQQELEQKLKEFRSDIDGILEKQLESS